MPISTSEPKPTLGADTVRNADRHWIGMARRKRSRGDWTPLESGDCQLPQKRLTMRKLKEVLRLHSLGLSQHQIARSCSISQSTVHEYVSASEAAGVKWPCAGELERPADRANAVSAKASPCHLAKTSGAGLDQGPRRPADAQGPDPGSWSGRRAARATPTATATAASATTTGGG